MNSDCNIIKNLITKNIFNTLNLFLLEFMYKL